MEQALLTGPASRGLGGRAGQQRGRHRPMFVEKMAKAFAGPAVELVYVDDGSSDGTAAAARPRATREPRVRLIRQRRRLGLTEALNRGFRSPRRHHRVPPRRPGVRPRDGRACCSASSTRATTHRRRLAPGCRDGKRVASRIANVACRLLFGLEVHDLNWIKAFRREVTDGSPCAPSGTATSWSWPTTRATGSARSRSLPPREAGRSKLGLGRPPVSAIDVVTLKFLLTFQRKPIIFSASARP